MLTGPVHGCSYDEHGHERFIPGDPSKRAFTYFVLTGGRFIYASAIRLAVLKFLLSMTVRYCLLAPAGARLTMPWPSLRTRAKPISGCRPLLTCWPWPPWR